MTSSVDIPKLLSAAVDIEKALKTPVSVNVLIDETAAPEFQSFVRSGFNSDSPNARLMVSYFPTQTPDPRLECDIVIICAGNNPEIGQIAASFKAENKPVLLVTQDKDGLMKAAEESGKSLDVRDIVAAKIGQPFDEAIKGELADEIGTWVARFAGEKKLSFSLAYPFVRRPIAKESVNITAAENAGIGLVVFVPAADMPLMTANQAKMVLQIAAAYGEPLTPDRVKELGAVLGSALIFRGVSRQVAGLVPAIGPAVKAAMGYAGTVAIGNAAIDYFENGGNIAGLAAVVGDARKSAIDAAAFVKAQPVYQAAAEKVGPKAKQVGSAVAKNAGPVLAKAGSNVIGLIKKKK